MQARNRAAAEASADYLVFRDADDRLADRYIEAMREQGRPMTLVQPAQRRGDNGPTWTVGGFRDWAALEDWDLWVRCWLAGASVAHAPEAVWFWAEKRTTVSLASVMGPPCCHEHGTTWKCYRA